MGRTPARSIAHGLAVSTVMTGLWFGCSAAASPPPTDDGLWSLRPVGNPDPPARAEGAWGHNPIDAFVGVSLDERSLRPAPPAARRALIRRASYGLTGLPPKAERVARFVADPRRDSKAIEDLVEELLASRHYGEHWGRHWLDVVRYADTAGENSDHPVPQAWRYRNWVTGAFNEDKPYDQFVQEQVAGDLIGRDRPAAARNDAIVATGYLALARRFGHDIDKSMHLTFEDAIDNLGKAFLGLSVSCARCHDHKHDPITMRDYYALYAVLDSTRFSFPGCEPKQQPRDLVPLVEDGTPSQRAAWEQRRDELLRKREAAGEAALAERAGELAEGSRRVVSRGEVPDSGSAHVSETPIEVEVRAGEAIQLSILPRANHGADTTILDYTITWASEQETTRWTLTDLLDNLLEGNPHSTHGGAAWCFLDTAGPPKALTVREDAVEGKSALQSWNSGSLPSVMVNTSTEPVKVWYTLPPRTFFCHPSERGPVSIVWLSPVEGKVSIDLTVRDGHPGGDGVAWELAHFADPAMASAYRELALAGSVRSEVEKEIAAHATREPKAAVAYAVTEGEPKPARIQERGDPELPGEEVPRHFLQILGGGFLGDQESSGRLALARYLTNADNPLTARVMVNRIWAWHFGRGLVATPNDFGNHGAAPSHPELLDYLARYFMDHGWSVKAMHRLIMSSATYQQAARDGTSPDCLAGFARRRLTAEELRDTLLLASGRLDRTIGGAHPFPPVESWGFTQHAPFADEYPSDRRSVYLMRKRNRTSRFFALFNGADPNASTAERDVTTVPTQALYFMNDPFFHRCAAQFAERIRKAADDPAGRLDFASRELFARPATEADAEVFHEFAAALDSVLPASPEFKDAELWESYARILLGSNELLHID